MSKKGYKQTQEHRRKLSLAKIGNKNPMKKLEVREKQSKTRKKLGLKPPSNLGKKFSDQHKKKLSETHKGVKSSLWKGGISFEPYSSDWTKTLRRSIRERDNYICKICGAIQGDISFDVHHIDYNKKNCNPINLITLCMKCHRKTGGNRKFWLNYFKEKTIWKQ